MEIQTIRDLMDALRGLSPAKTPEESLALRSQIFDALDEAEIAPKRKAVKSVAKKDPHTVIVYAMDYELEAIVFSVPNAKITPELRKSLEAVRDLTFAGPLDCEDYGQYGHAIRILAVLGQQRPGEWKAIYPDMQKYASKADKLPTPAEIAKLEKLWWDDMVFATYGADGDRLKTGLDERITDVVVLHQAM